LYQVHNSTATINTPIINRLRIVYSCEIAKGVRHEHQLSSYIVAPSGRCCFTGLVTVRWRWLMHWISLPFIRPYSPLAYSRRMSPLLSGSGMVIWSADSSVNDWPDHSLGLAVEDGEVLVGVLSA
jgi:hypothetical protein